MKEKEALLKSPRDLLWQMLKVRLSSEAFSFIETSIEEISSGVSQVRMAQLISLCSRYARRHVNMEPSLEELKQASDLVVGWSPERWSVLDTMRVLLIVSYPEYEEPGDFDAIYEECFRFADEGETCALYKALPLLHEKEGGERFGWRAAEGCRTNMKSVFESVACDSPYPVKYFDDIAWRQLVIKAVFIDAPLWRVVGLDNRLSEDLARMALDMIDERRSAGRSIPPMLWMCFGKFGGKEVLGIMQEELASCIDLPSSKAVVLALARAGQVEIAEQLVQNNDKDLIPLLNGAKRGDYSQSSFSQL